MTKTSSTAAFFVSLCLGVVVLNAKDLPISIERQGYLFAGGKYSTVNGQQVMSGQIYAEYQIPAKQTHRWPLLMIHGLGQSGTNFTGTSDGREGWAQYFLRQGYAVYVIDQPGRGRAAYQSEAYGPLTPPDIENVQRRFVAPERYELWPQARLHTQWPGKGAPGDPIFDQFYASQLPSISAANATIFNRDAIVALLEKIGPAIVMTHSQSGGFGWPVADMRPDLVKAIIAVEPSGPPFYDIENIGAPDWFRDAPTSYRVWGPTAAPLTYAPPAANPSDLTIVREERADAPNVVRCWLQKSPARQLPNLQKMPILIMTAEASYHATYDHCTVKFLEQAGVHPTWLKLGESGIHGNGHMLMLEQNSREIVEVIARWLAKAIR
ncbi:MAG TPA: alpha/beta hydrolase [Terriglobia bacterium]|nr:alpha/beta hydrolase [Terriglobia bacterium]